MPSRADGDEAPGRLAVDSAEAGANKMQSVERLLLILETVATQHRPVSPTHVAESTGLAISTVARLMVQYAAHGLLYRVDESHYLLGKAFHRMMQRELSHERTRVNHVVESVLADLRDAVGETVSLHVRSGTQRLAVAVAQSMEAVARVVLLGEALPLYGSGTGEVLMTDLPPEAVIDLLRAVDVPPPEIQDTLARVETIRRQGWSIVADRWVFGVTGLSVPVHGSDGFLAALTVSGPSFRFDEAVARSGLGRVQAAAAELAGEITATARHLRVAV